MVDEISARFIERNIRGERVIPRDYEMVVSFADHNNVYAKTELSALLKEENLKKIKSIAGLSAEVFKGLKLEEARSVIAACSFEQVSNLRYDLDENKTLKGVYADDFHGKKIGTELKGKAGVLQENFMKNLAPSLPQGLWLTDLFGQN